MIEIIGPLAHGALTPAGKPVPLQKQLIERLLPLSLRFAQSAHRRGERREAGFLPRQPLAHALRFAAVFVVTGDQPVDPLFHVG